MGVPNNTMAVTAMTEVTSESWTAPRTKGLVRAAPMSAWVTPRAMSTPTGARTRARVRAARSQTRSWLQESGERGAGRVGGVRSGSLGAAGRIIAPCSLPRG